MLRIKHMPQIGIAILFLIFSVFMGGISVFAEENEDITEITYGNPIPSELLNLEWNEPKPDKLLPTVGTYTSTIDSKILKVNRRPITITPDSKTKTVGEKDPELTYQITSGSLVAGETLTGDISRVAGETIGNYSILQGTLTTAKNSNYAITFIKGKTLTITSSSSYFNIPVTVKYGDSFSSRGKMPEESYGYSSVPDLKITIYQETPTKDASLEFDSELTAGALSDESVTLYVALPSSFSRSKQYYVRRSCNDSDRRLTADIERHDDYYYLVFTTSEVSHCTFRVMRKSSDHDDDNYTISSFWEDVIDDIIDADYGDRVRENVGSRTKMAAEVLRELKGLPIILSLQRSNGQIINIDGKDVGYISSSRDYFMLSDLADRFYTSNPIESAPVRAAVPIEPEVQPSSSAIAAVPKVEPTPMPAPVQPKVQSWTPPASSSVPEPLPSSSDASSLELDEPSSSSTASESSEPQEESDFEIIAEEDEPYVDADGDQVDSSGTISFFPLFVVGSLAAAGTLAGIVTAIVCKSRRNSR